MSRRFNITGVCVQKMHYMVNITPKINTILTFVEDGLYFSINRPRQYGKTTSLVSIENQLNTKDNYLVSSISFEGVGDDVFKLESTLCPMILRLIANGLSFTSKTYQAQLNALNQGVSCFEDMSKVFSEFVQKLEKKVVLIIDEVDKSSNNQLFLSFLGTLRNKYLLRNVGKDFTFHSVILAGVHDVKTLKIKLNPNTEFKYNSPWNIATDFDVDMSFNPQEISTMLVDYVAEKNVEMDIPAISNRIYHYTSGYPFLVSRICKEIDEKILPIKTVMTWNINDVELAVKTITNERNTNFESIVKYLEDYTQLYEYIENLITANKVYTYNVLNPTINLGEIHGIFANRNQKVVIANKIYDEVLTNYITSKLKALQTWFKAVI